MTKILIVANIRENQGGITTQVHQLAEALRSEGNEVKIISTHGSIAKRLTGVMSSYSEADYFDIILGVGCAYTGFFPIFVSSVVSYFKNKKLIVNFHDGQISEFMKKYYGIINLIIKNTQVVVATKFLYDTFTHYGFKSVLINNHFNNLKQTENIKQNTNKIKIIWARSFEDLYRADMALEAARELRSFKNVEFHFYGYGSKYDYFKQNYNYDNIFFYGGVKRELLLEKYSEYDIFLNTTEYDNFPMSIVEAGMNKLIVITSNAGGIKDLYDESEVIYFKSGDYEGLKNVLINVICNIEKYKVYSYTLHEKVLTFNWENVRESWLKILTK